MVNQRELSASGARDGRIGRRGLRRTGLLAAAAVTTALLAAAGGTAATGARGESARTTAGCNDNKIVVVGHSLGSVEILECSFEVALALLELGEVNYRPERLRIRGGGRLKPLSGFVEPPEPEQGMAQWRK